MKRDIRYAGVSFRARHELVGLETVLQSLCGELLELIWNTTLGVIGVASSGIDEQKSESGIVLVMHFVTGTDR